MATSAPSPTPAAVGEIATPAVPGPVAGLVARPRLFAALERGSAGPVTLLTGPAGSGKTMLLSSWLRSVDPPPAVAWVDVERDERDATRFWATVIDAVRRSGAVATGDPLTTLTPGPGGRGDEFLERLLDGLGRLERPVFLVLDDLHHLRADDALAGLERLLTRGPPRLRTFIVSRRDPKLGLHRLRLAGGLVELRGADLGFTAEETAALLTAAGVAVGEDDLGRLHERTEGWAAGLRLAAMSLSRHGAPDRFVAEFSGSERTVADYLVGEVLASRPPEVRRLLLRTCILERVTGPLADLLTGRTDGARLLHELEEANALVVAVDVARTWFRYHHLLADLLRLELRLEAPGDVPALHRLAAGWFAEHGHAVEAIRHAQLGGDPELAAELIGRHWVHLVLDGEESTLGTLLAGLPPGLVETDAELAAIAAAAGLAESRWEQADALLAAADSALPGLPDARRRRAATALATADLMRARRLGDMERVVAVADAVARSAADIPTAGGAAADELEALALMNLGIAESWILRLDDAEAHLERGLALGRRAGRAYVEVGCLGGLGTVANVSGRLGVALDRLRQAVAVAERVGWVRHPVVGASYLSLAAAVLERGRLAEAASLLDRAEPILTEWPEPAANVGLHHVQGMLAMAQGRYADAVARFLDGERLAASLRAPHFLATILRQWELRGRLRLGEADAVRAALADLEPGAQTQILSALVALIDDEPEAAVEAVAPVLAGEVFIVHLNVEIEASLVDAIARTALGDAAAAQASVERALALSEREGRTWVVSTVRGARDLLAAHPAHRTAHAAQLRVLLDHLSGIEPVAAASEEPPAEALSERELAVLRFLPTNLSASEIGGELYLSVHTVKTHMRRLYAKLDVHTRAEAVARGRALGLLAPAVRRV
jgi:LuxR family transcriptional regulator, maltose regulon positive regulatory protein